MIRGTCEPSKLLDLIENFILFSESEGGLVKLLARNHQYLGVNKAIAAVRRLVSLTPAPSPSGRGEEEQPTGGDLGTTPSASAKSFAFR